MGYTHYIKTSRDFTDAEWTAIQEKAEAIFGSTRISLADEGGESGTTPYLDEECIEFNGVDDQAYETACISKAAMDFQFCKTQFRPYDEVVVEFYAMVESVAPDAVSISSDGGDEVFVPFRKKYSEQ